MSVMKTRILKMKDGSFNFYRGSDWAGWYFPRSRFARVYSTPLSKVPEYEGVICPCKVCEFSGTCKDCPHNLRK